MRTSACRVRGTDNRLLPCTIAIHKAREEEEKKEKVEDTVAVCNFHCNDDDREMNFFV